MALHDRLLNAVHYIPYIVIADVGACREAKAHFKEILFDAIGIYWCTGIHRLLVY